MTPRDRYLANQDKEQQREDRITNRREYMYQNPVISQSASSTPRPADYVPVCTRFYPCV